MHFNFSKKKIITITPQKGIKGRVLFSYIPEPVGWKSDDSRLNGHSNKWESREIANIFFENGYIVDAISWLDSNIASSNKYDFFFDIFTNLNKVDFPNKKNTIKLLHLTGSYCDYQNKAELKRIEEFTNKTNVFYSPKRQVHDIEGYKKSIHIANYCSLIGNQHTLDTFPKSVRKKITLVTVSASNLKTIKSKKDYLSNHKEYLWFFGFGCVHKGLDIVIDYFMQHKDRILNIVGDIKLDKDFLKVYGKYINKGNIRAYGFLSPNSTKFNKVLGKCYAFIAPSCSESISTSVVTCMTAGLYPIISTDTGASLPDKCGIILDSCSEKSIERAIDILEKKDDKRVEYEIGAVQDYALKNYSRSAFRKGMENYIKDIIKNA
jgi:hypothetical protein